MARDYKREYQLAKGKESRTALTTRVPKTIAEDLRAKCALEGTTPNAVLKAFTYAYINGELAFDGESIRAQK